MCCMGRLVFGGVVICCFSFVNVVLMSCLWFGVIVLSVGIVKCVVWMLLMLMMVMLCGMLCFWVCRVVSVLRVIELFE